MRDMRTVEQLSIFIENKFGSLTTVLEVLENTGATIIASSVADTTEYGILRLITTDTAAIAKVFQVAHINVFISEVLMVSCKPDAGSFAQELKNFTNEGVVIEYMYSFNRGNETAMVIKPNDLKAAERAVEKYSITLLNEYNY